MPKAGILSNQEPSEFLLFFKTAALQIEFERAEWFFYTSLTLTAVAMRTLGSRLPKININ